MIVCIIIVLIAKYTSLIKIITYYSFNYLIKFYMKKHMSV